MKTILITISILLLATGCGMMAISELVTPADIDQGAVNYAVEAGVAHPNDYAGYPNLAKARKLKEDVDAGHSTVQLSLQQQAEKDNLDYSIHTDSVTTNLKTATAREEALFGEGGLLSTGLALAGMGGFTGLLGLMRKRPGDMTPEEVNAAVAETGLIAEQKQKQVMQIVKGVQSFMDSYKDKNGDLILALKTELDRHQDSDTKQAVAVAKAGA